VLNALRDRPEQLVGQFMADASLLRELTAQVLPLVDNFPRRIGATLYTERSTPRYVSLMDAGRARDRMAGSPWASSVLPAALVADSREAFRRRAILQAAFYPQLRPADYDFWRDIAGLIRSTDLVELPRWLLGSGARVAQIAARTSADDPAYPLAAEHLAINALANRRAPPKAIEKSAFMAMTAKGQIVTVFHHCVAGQPAQARTLMGWIPEDLRAQQVYRSFLSWADKECVAQTP